MLIFMSAIPQEVSMAGIPIRRTPGFAHLNAPTLCRAPQGVNAEHSAHSNRFLPMGVHFVTIREPTPSEEPFHTAKTASHESFEFPLPFSQRFQ
jgi:hypothetical protein